MKYTRISVKDCPTWEWISDGKKIVYVEKKDKFHGEAYSVSSVHKPNTTTGTGFRLDDYVTPAELITKLPIYLASFAPTWADSKDLASVVKYKDLEEFINYERKTWGDRLIIK